ncbi:MAG TPA: choice-of-anchor Q domain-containing protein, partial [Acidimicrobiales bacterium]|nr:choice-of-anchor Q domain-containing protein [Acidimicrobiales bacterium]
HLVNITLQNGSAAGDGGAVLVLNASSVHAVDARFDSNEASGSGGALEIPLEAFVARSDFTGNVAASGDGGALDAAAAAGQFRIRQSQFVENHAPAGEGGAVSAIGFGSISTGDGVRGSSFVGNTARRGGALVLSSGIGVANSTIVNNMATVGGGGILAETTSASAGTYLTVTGNAAPDGANLSYRGHDLHLFFSVIAEPEGGGENCHITGSIHPNLVHTDDHSCGHHQVNSGPPQLGPLTDNGGRTLTREPLAGSPLLDAIPVDYGFPALLDGCARFEGLDPVDQRGVVRPQDGDGQDRNAFFDGEPIRVPADCDIGAVEAEAFVAPPTGPVLAGPPFTG